MLSAYANRNQSNWDTYLLIIIHAYNTTINSVTGYTPFFNVHDHEARRPTDLWMEECIEQLRDKSLAQYIIITHSDDRSIGSNSRSTNTCARPLPPTTSTNTTYKSVPTG
jgi:hypothetical protein